MKFGVLNVCSNKIGVMKIFPVLPQQFRLTIESVRSCV